MKETSRRDFLKSTTLATSAIALPSFGLTRSLSAAASKVNVAVVGAGGMGDMP